MLDKKIYTTKGREHVINSTNPAVVEWFERGTKEADVTQTENMLDQINNERLYDPVLADKEDLIVLDIGANIGLFSLYVQDSAKQIIALEPTPATFSVLTEMCKDVEKIKPVSVALSDHDGEIIFYVHENPTINSLVELKEATPVTVQCKTIETILNEQGLDWVDFVKCDIEGSEMIAITEATLTPVKDRIGSWFFEMHQTNRSEASWPGNLEENRQKLITILKNVGYGAEPILHDQIFAWKE
jgi:FkbM family methyltransferase